MDRIQSLLDAISAESNQPLVEFVRRFSWEDFKKDLRRIMELRLSDPPPSDLKAFTMAAMQGLCANSVFNSPFGADQTPEGIVAQIAVSIARATLTELSKHQ